MKNVKHIIIALAVSSAAFISGNALALDIVVDPKGHDPAAMEQDIRECRELAANMNFDVASDYAGKAVARGAIIGGSAAVIAGGNKEVRRRSVAGGALAGGIAKNAGNRMDRAANNVKSSDAERNCLIGRGYNPLN